ncbi:Uncharacterised protein [Eikenella corrodens]|nr:N-6 DNA methylase [Eikenella corrodens]UAK74328.1 SAM-dependent methyltransferase [Eikenella corrodens]SNW10157.1 Uncharacterised protein [Eikenella corrodens]
MTFQEHNNRKNADKFAEYITGETLRRFVADTVRRFAGDHPSVLDGAAGSGQLEQFVQPSEFEAVEIQESACQALRQNYPHAAVSHTSFFLYRPQREMDCAIMNPPFSLKFKDLPDSEKLAVQQLFPWKKSGCLDDIFILKSLQQVRRFSFQVAFPGIAYRAAEARMRQTVGCRLAELWTVENAFEDTKINVLFIVIDKQKDTPEYRSGVYDCTAAQIVCEQRESLDEACNWPLPRRPVEAEAKMSEAAIDALNQAVLQSDIKRLENSLEWQLSLISLFGAAIDFLHMLAEIRRLCNQYEERFYAIKS